MADDVTTPDIGESAGTSPVVAGLFGAAVLALVLALLGFHGAAEVIVGGIFVVALVAAA